ncbi:PD-(D/E)XK nuclease family protein [Actinospongicola halichondriae]|uniref:PD-(D/E)XK nuclease family protein n=1 Tax=Actinospongicola halichondriae TaxID=3236844 RepID=UPI003D45D73C
MSEPTTSTLEYRPAQQRVIDLLGRHHDDAPDLGPEIATELRAELEERLADVSTLIPDGADLWVGKTPLAAFNACPGRWQAQLDTPFSWSIPAVRGTVSHKAIELTLNWRGPVEPGRAVDAAIDHLLEDEYGSAGTFLRTLTTVDLAELRSASVDLVTAFEECFPPLKPRWRPVIDGRSRADLCGGRIVLSGRPDLTLGQALRAGKVIIDLKTGSAHPHHVDDLRFYALIDTLRIGLPPRRLATMYLDSGQPVAETVTAGVLEAATERVVRTVTAMIETRWGTAPTRLRTGAHCSWCPGRATCRPGLEREVT